MSLQVNFNTLPKEMITEILSSLGIKTLRRCCMVNKQFREIIFNSKFLRAMASNAEVPMVVSPSKWLIHTIHSKKELFKYIKYIIKLTKSDEIIVLNFRSFSGEIIRLDLQNSDFYTVSLSKQEPNLVDDVSMDKGIMPDLLTNMTNHRKTYTIKTESKDGVKKIQIKAPKKQAILALKRALNTAFEATDKDIKI